MNQETLKQARKGLEITQQEAADRIGVSIGMYRKYENGQRIIERAGLAVRRNIEAMIKEAGA